MLALAPSMPSKMRIRRADRKMTRIFHELLPVDDATSDTRKHPVKGYTRDDVDDHPRRCVAAEHTQRVGDGVAVVRIVCTRLDEDVYAEERVKQAIHGRSGEMVAELGEHHLHRHEDNRVQTILQPTCPRQRCPWTCGQDCPRFPFLKERKFFHKWLSTHL